MRSRRNFLKSSSAIASAPLIIPNLTSSASPNSKLSHAVIGSDGQGWSDLNNIASHPNVNITAICDVDTSRMAKAAAKFPNARKYQDWRSYWKLKETRSILSKLQLRIICMQVCQSQR